MPEPAYKSKRRFDATPEPPPPPVSDDVDPLTAPPGERFVIQQHYATRLHHDLRLEMLNGPTPVLVSWAVPRRLPREKGIKSLAIRTEDHPMEYATFSGSIPGANYGAGEVRIFDSGRYDVLDRSEDRLTVRLEGERQRGVYHLIHTGLEEGKDQWLAILSEDERPPPGQKPDPDPMLATSAQEPFDSPDWAFEPKWDGIRAIADCYPTTRLISRNRRDITAGYPELSRLHERLVALDAMIDGEIVAFDESGPSFQMLQRRMHVRDPVQIERLMKTIPVVFMAFDILYLDGHDLTTLSYAERRDRLETTLVPSNQVQLSPTTPGDGIALFRVIADRGMEGVVAKRLDSPYEPGIRSRAWLKLKTSFDADVVIVGWTMGSGRREGTVGSLVMAMYDQGTLRYVGQVGTGFNQRSLEETRQRLIELGEAPPPFDREALRGAPELRKARWVPPVLVAAVEHRQVTSAGRLRAPSFKGFREDKRPEECTVDQLT